MSRERTYSYLSDVCLCSTATYIQFINIYFTIPLRLFLLSVWRRLIAGNGLKKKKKNYMRLGRISFICNICTHNVGQFNIQYSILVALICGVRTLHITAIQFSIADCVFRAYICNLYRVTRAWIIIKDLQFFVRRFFHAFAWSGVRESSFFFLFFFFVFHPIFSMQFYNIANEAHTKPTSV